MRKQVIISSRQKIQLLSLAILCTFLVGSTHAQTKPWIAPKAAINVKSPITGNDSVLTAGRTLYVSNCAPCHGVKGNGLGPSNASISPSPANHSALSMINETDGSLFYKVSEGRSPMPQYKYQLSEDQRWGLVAYIRTLPKIRK
jgi:mono/diheme cytochrome c family protein